MPIANGIQDFHVSRVSQGFFRGARQSPNLTKGYLLLGSVSIAVVCDYGLSSFFIVNGPLERINTFSEAPSTLSRNIPLLGHPMTICGNISN